MRYFLSGVMQGSTQATNIKDGLDCQNYRDILSSMIRKYDNNAEIYDPYLKPKAILENNEKLLESNDFIKPMFEEIIQEAVKSDIIVSYLPTASMGSAVEIWEGAKANVRHTY
jgi:hypothetical protein